MRQLTQNELNQISGGRLQEETRFYIQREIREKFNLQSEIEGRVPKHQLAENPTPQPQTFPQNTYLIMNEENTVEIVDSPENPADHNFEKYRLFKNRNDWV